MPFGPASRLFFTIARPDIPIHNRIQFQKIFLTHSGVLPTRVARNGAALTREGRINMRNQQYADDERTEDDDGD